MKENSQESIKKFGDVVELGKSISHQEAVEKLAKFHNVPVENILNAFFNLRTYKEGNVVFSKGLSNGAECISMNGYNANSKRICNSLINIYTGQPIEHVS